MSKVGKILVLMVVVLFVGVGVAFAAGETDTADVDIYVTPGNITASLTALTTYYSFGTVDLSASSVSVSGIVLQNGSAATVDVDKSITGVSANTTLAYPADEKDEFSLWCVGGTPTQPDGSVFGASHQFTDTEGAYNDLTDTSGTAISSLGVGLGTTTWYKITMPPSVTDSTQRKFDLTFQATTN